MPISKYFKGKGEQVLKSMKEQYGPKKGEQVFYATANKEGMKPAEDEEFTKPLAIGNGFEYWEQAGEVYRTPIGNRGYANKNGVPSNARWECSKAHFDRFRDVLLGNDEEIKPVGYSSATTGEIRKVQALASCPFSVAAACYMASGGSIEKAIQCAKKKWPSRLGFGRDASGYSVNGKHFDRFLDAVKHAEVERAEVIEEATGVRRWTPIPNRQRRGSVAAKRHEIKMPDGTFAPMTKENIRKAQGRDVQVKGPSDIKVGARLRYDGNKTGTVISKDSPIVFNVKNDATGLMHRVDAIEIDAVMKQGRDDFGISGQRWEVKSTISGEYANGNPARIKAGQFIYGPSEQSDKSSMFTTSRGEKVWVDNTFQENLERVSRPTRDAMPLSPKAIQLSELLSFAGSGTKNLNEVFQSTGWEWDSFNAALESLKRAGLVMENGNSLRWLGGKAKDSGETFIPKFSHVEIQQCLSQGRHDLAGEMTAKNWQAEKEWLRRRGLSLVRGSAPTGRGNDAKEMFDPVTKKFVPYVPYERIDPVTGKSSGVRDAVNDASQASMFPGKTFINENGLSQRGFRSKEAMERFSDQLFASGRTSSASSTGSYDDPRKPNSYGVFVLSWRESKAAKDADHCAEHSEFYPGCPMCQDGATKGIDSEYVIKPLLSTRGVTKVMLVRRDKDGKEQVLADGSRAAMEKELCRLTGSAKDSITPTMREVIRQKTLGYRPNMIAYELNMDVDDVKSILRLFDATSEPLAKDRKCAKDGINLLRGLDRMMGRKKLLRALDRMIGRTRAKDADDSKVLLTYTKHFISGNLNGLKVKVQFILPKDSVQRRVSELKEITKDYPQNDYGSRDRFWVSNIQTSPIARDAEGNFQYLVIDTARGGKLLKVLPTRESAMQHAERLNKPDDPNRYKVRTEYVTKLARRAMDAVYVDTRQFENTYLKKPRGVGGWMFAFKEHAAPNEVFEFYGPYSSSLEKAKAEAQRRGERVVYVQA